MDPAGAGPERDGQVAAPRRRRSRPLRIVLNAAAALVLLVAAGFVLLRLGAFDRLALREASRRLERTAGLRLEAETVEIDPFRLSLRLEAPALRAVPGRGAVLREFTADTISLDIPWSLLLGGGLRFQKVRVVRPAVSLAPAAGPTEPAREPSAPADAASGAAGFDLRIDDLVIEEGSASWAGAPGTFGVSMAGLELEVLYKDELRAHSVVLAAGDGRFGYSDASLDIVRLDLRGLVGADEARVEALELETERSFLSLSGTVGPFGGATEFEGRARVSLSVSEVPPVAPFMAGAEGRLDAVVSVASRAGRLAYEAAVSSTGLRTRDLSETDLAIDARGDADSVTVSRIDLRTEAGAIDGSFKADLKGRTVSGAELEWSGLDPDRILPLLRLPEGPRLLLGSLVGGRLSGRAEPLSLAGFEGSVSLTLTPKPPSAAAAGPGTPVLRPSGEFSFRASGGKLELDMARLSAAGTSLTASGTYGRDGRLDVRYSVGIENLAATADALRHLGLGFPQSGPFALGRDEISGRLSVSGSLAGRPAELAFTANADFPELALGTLRAGPLKAELRGDRARLEVLSLEGTVAGGSVRGWGAVPLGRGRRRSGLELEGVDLATLARFLPRPWAEELGGRLSARAEIDSGPDGLSADLLVEAEDIAAASLSLPRFKAEGSYAASRLDLSDVLVETGTGVLSGKGGLDLEAGTFSADLRSDGFDLATLGPLVPAGLGLAGRAVLRVNAEGAFTAPRGTLALTVSDLRAGRFSASKAELKASSDGASVEASLGLPDHRARLESSLALAPPYAITGKLSALGLPLDRLAGAAPVKTGRGLAEGTEPSGPRLDLEAVFAYPLTDPSGFTADLSFSGKGFAIGSSDEDPGAGPGSGLTASIAGRVLASGDPMAPADLELEGEITRLLVAAGEKSVSNDDSARFRLADGELRIDPFSLSGSAGSISVAGTVGPLPGATRLDASLRADLDAAVLSPLVGGMALGGRLRADLDVRGEPAALSLAGRAGLEEGFVRAADFPLILNGIAAEMTFEGSRLEISRLDGTANGGPLRVRGAVDGLLGASPPAGELSIDAKGFQLEYPPGLRTTSDIALTLSGRGGKWTLAGSMKVLRGLFREDVSPGGSILGFGSYRWVQTESELPAFIRGIGLDIGVETAEPIVFRNNLADLGVLADVRVSGNPGLPLFSGRLTNDAVGTITFGEREFVVETVRLDLLGQRVPDPNIEIVAHTSVTHDQEPLDVRLRLYGRASDLRYSLTSTPPRSKEDLSLILLTGQSLEEVRGNALNTLTAQTLRFFASPVASPVTGTLERLLKAEDISFTPLLISAETDPGARFTFRKKISGDVQVIYSLDITSTQDQTLLLDYRLKRDFSLQAFRKDNGSYGASLRHSLPIRLRSSDAGGADRKAAPVLSELTLEGDPELPPETVGSALRGLREGRPFSYARLNAAVDRLVKAYRKRGYINADVRPTLTPSEDGTRTEVRLDFSPGRPVRILYEGDGVSSRARRAIAKNWTGLLPEDVNLGDASDLILERLRRKGYHEARVETEKRGGEDESVYVVTVVKGPRYRVRRLNVDGNAVLPTEAIRKAASKYPLAPFKGLWNLVYDPRAALDAIAGAYRDIGHTDARVRRQQVLSDPGTRTVDIRLSVSEGPRRMVRSVGFADHAALGESELRRVVQSAEGRPLDPAQVLRDRDALLAFCRSRGFLEAEVVSEVAQAPDGPDVDIVFRVREGAVHTVAGLEVAGNGRTRDALVLKAAGIRKGDVFSFEALAAGQKRLYDLGVFRAVDISAPESNGESTGVPVQVDVREEPPLTFTYGLRYSSEEKLEGQVGLSMVNLFGHGRTALASYRQSARLWDARLAINLPYVFGYRADTRLTFSTSRETREAYISDEIAGSIGHEIKFRKDLEINALYKLSRVRERAPGEAAFGPSVVLSELVVTGVRDTRDDRFDAKAGSFLSFSLTGAPKVFGSGLPYVKAFTQYSFFRKAWGPVGWASNVRLGAVTAFGEALPASRLFYAGGGTSLRGFRQDMVGPIDPLTGLPTGGKIALLVNQELRVPIFPFLSGVAFYDVGNVYASLRSLGRFDLRQGVGAGLRASSPIGLIRFDCGFNPFRRPGEPSVVLFLSIGQAF